MKTIGDRMDAIMDEVDYHLLWYKWFSKYPPNKEIIEFNEMTKSKQMDFLKQYNNSLKEKENGK